MKRWQVLFVAGLSGILSLLLVPIETLLPHEARPLVLRLLVTINPLILLVLAITLGEVAARKVGLRAPLVDAILKSGEPWMVFRRQWKPALIVAGIVAAILVLYSKTIGSQLAAAAGSPTLLGSFSLPLLTKLLYGGVTEEVIARWGLVSCLVWLGWQASRRPEQLPAAVVAGSVTLAALLFAVGHLPLLFLVAPAASTTTVVIVLAANTAPGILFGWLYVRWGLEAAILAHAAAHLLATVVSALF